MILCDFFPLYDFECHLINEHQTDNEALPKSVPERSISNLTNTNSTGIADPSLAYGFKEHTRPTTSEIILHVWIFTLFCEEIRQVKRRLSFVNH